MELNTVSVFLFSSFRVYEHIHKKFNFGGRMPDVLFLRFPSIVS